jgi:cysteine desulfuration protein SufE
MKAGQMPAMSWRRSGLATLDEIRANFEVLDDWEDRYRYVIELGRTLSPMAAALKTETSKVRGCASQVWLVSETRATPANSAPELHFIGDSDAHIVRGLIAVLFALFEGKTANEILETDASAVFKELGLAEHLTPQRSNGLASMVERIRADARTAAAESATAN